MAYENNDKKMESIYSKRIRAGKRRTYFFDVRATKGNDYYLTITESRKRFDDNGYDRHKVFLYKEDFEKFMDGLQEVIDFINENQLYEEGASSDFVLEVGMDEDETEIQTVSKKDFTNIDFDDFSH